MQNHRDKFDAVEKAKDGNLEGDDLERARRPEAIDRYRSSQIRGGSRSEPRQSLLSRKAVSAALADRGVYDAEKIVQGSSAACASRRHGRKASYASIVDFLRPAPSLIRRISVAVSSRRDRRAWPPGVPRGSPSSSTGVGTGTLSCVTVRRPAEEYDL